MKFLHDIIDQIRKIASDEGLLIGIAILGPFAALGERIGLLHLRGQYQRELHDGVVFFSLAAFCILVAKVGLNIWRRVQKDVALRRGIRRRHEFGLKNFLGIREANDVRIACLVYIKAIGDQRFAANGRNRVLRELEDQYLLEDDDPPESRSELTHFRVPDAIWNNPRLEEWTKAFTNLDTRYPPWSERI